MRIQEKQKALEQEVIANLCAIPKMPENMLPHTVYVEEEGEDGYGHGIPVYTMYRLEEIRTDGSCTLYNAESRERFTCRHLHEINMDWLVTVWERYLPNCASRLRRRTQTGKSSFSKRRSADRTMKSLPVCAVCCIWQTDGKRRESTACKAHLRTITALLKGP